MHRLITAMRSASEHLYDVTDGQMKLGKVRIRRNVSTDSEQWKNADVHVYDNDTQWPSARLNGIYSK